MWYYYTNDFLETSKLKEFSDDLNETFYNMFKGVDKDSFISSNFNTKLGGCNNFFSTLNYIYEYFF